MKQIIFLMAVMAVAACLFGCGQPSPYGIAYKNATGNDLLLDATTGGVRVSPGVLGGNGKDGHLGATLFPILVIGNKVHLRAMTKDAKGEYSIKIFEKDVVVSDQVISEAQRHKGYVQIEIGDGGRALVYAFSP